jgi:lysophospholipase L1-like esterase
MFYLRRQDRGTRDHITPIGVLHSAVRRWGDAETTTARYPVRRWLDGIAHVDVQALTFAEYWRAHNKTALAAEGPLWVVLGDSTAQGVGASSPLHGYVGQVLAALAPQAKQPWRVVNLSRSGALAEQVLAHQLPVLESLGQEPDLVTCGVGSNDILGTLPKRLHSTLRYLIDRLPRSSVVMDLPLPDGLWTIGGLCSPYVSGVNKTIHTAATERGLPVANVSRHFAPPWRGKFAADRFHPNDLGYRHQANAVLAALPKTITQTR